MAGVQDTGSLKMVVKINGPIEELVNVREQLLIQFIEGENDVVIEIDESNSVGG